MNRCSKRTGHGQTSSSSDPLLPSTDLGSSATQCRDDRHVAPSGGVAQRREATFRLGVDGGTKLEQQSHHVHVAQVGVDTQDGGVVQYLRTVVHIGPTKHEKPAHLNTHRIITRL